MRLVLSPPLVLVCTLWAATCPAASQEPPPQDTPPEEVPQEKLAEWPALADEKAAVLDVKRLRKAETETMASDAHERLVAAGAGAAPLLLAALERERDEAARERMIAVLDLVVGAPHTRLLAEPIASDAAHVRQWALSRAARFPDPGLRAAAEKALATARAREAKKKAEPEDVYLAALCATSTGSLLGLDTLFARARSEWGDHAHEMRTVLEAVRGPEATAAMTPRLVEPDRTSRVTALRLLAGCGEASCVSKIRPFLDDNDNGLRIEAINALRGVVDGEPPLERLPVFEAIELAAQWKRRV